MRDKTEQIFKAAIHIFTKKGFQATTQEIAKEADVAEVTLYRKFSTKQNLFISVVKTVIEKQFHSQIKKLAEEENTEEFFRKLIDNRLETLSKNAPIIKMLISESLLGNLSEEVNIPSIIYTSLKNGLDYHFKRINQEVDTELCARQLGGIFLSNIIFPADIMYHELKSDEQKRILTQYVKSMMSLL